MGAAVGLGLIGHEYGVSVWRRCLLVFVAGQLLLLYGSITSARFRVYWPLATYLICMASAALILSFRNGETTGKEIFVVAQLVVSPGAWVLVAAIPRFREATVRLAILGGTAGALLPHSFFK